MLASRFLPWIGCFPLAFFLLPLLAVFGVSSCTYCFCQKWEEENEYRKKNEESCKNGWKIVRCGLFKLLDNTCIWNFYCEGQRSMLIVFIFLNICIFFIFVILGWEEDAHRLYPTGWNGLSFWCHVFGTLFLLM